jgi:hypothetical protein
MVHCGVTETTDELSQIRMGSFQAWLRFSHFDFRIADYGVRMSLPTIIVCDHCGHHQDDQYERLGEIGAEGAWLCQACSLCNMTYHKPEGYVTVLGYQRDLEIGYL